MSLARELRRLAKSIEGVDQRRARTILTGTVAAVQGARVKVRLTAHGEAGEIVTPWLRIAAPTGRNGGGVSQFGRLGIGEAVAVISPSGEPGVASAVIPWVDTGQAPAPGAAENNGHVVTVGNARIEIDNGLIRLSVGAVSLELTDAGALFAGPRVSHDGLNIGKTHTHSGVVPGAANTLTPNP